MKKTILGLTVVAAVLVVSCSKKECSCNDGGNASAKMAIDLGLATVKENEAGCTALNNTVKLAFSGASCTWG